LWKGDSASPNWAILRARAREANTADSWRQLGDALALWGGKGRLDEAIDAYGRAARLDPKNGAALFRLGVCYRQRSESAERRSGDFQAAIDF
jgi:cytochrome c-type biogenesis protein CcmH/NrfG